MNPRPSLNGARTPAASRGPTLGLVGFGRFARNYYVPALRSLIPGARVCVADPLAEARDSAARLLPGSRSYPDHRAVLAREPLDGVLVASPPSTHLEVWQSAARHDLPVFLEKPFLAPGELDNIDPADPAWRNLMIDFPRRFWPAYRDLERRVSGGDLGRVSHAQLTLHIDLAPWLTVTRHRLDPDEGGVLYDLGSQALDLATMIFRQRPSEIRARRYGASGPRDRVVLDLGFASGLAVNCDLAYGDRNRESVRIYGEEGLLRLDDPNMLTWLERAPTRYRGAIRWCADTAALCYRGLIRDRSMLRYSVRAALEAFLRAVAARSDFEPGFEDALQIARWTEAAARALAEGRSIAVE